ncbi:MAG: MATE family efflux transporter [Bacillota bacterium]|nr:MATE family efflux transporter [Bacillota bacterium]
MYERSGQIIRQKFGEYLLPTVLTSMAISMASVVDGIIVGSLLGDVALAAVGLSGPLIFGINLIYMLFAVGGLTCASVSLGKRDFAMANQYFTMSVGGGLGAMGIFLLVMQIFLHPLCSSLAGGDLQLAALTESYLRPLLFTGPALMFSSGMAVFIRMDGNPKVSAVIVVIANAVNLVLDYVLIRFLNTGIAGAGLSTTLGYVAGSVIVIPYLLNKKRSFHFVCPGKSFLKTLRDILKSGMPKAVGQVCNLLRSLVINAVIVSKIGSIGMSIMTVCTNMLMISNIFEAGIADTLLPIVGTLYGERDFFGIRQAMKTARRVLMLTSAVLVAFFLTAPQLMGMLFGLTSQEALALLKPALRLFALYLPFSGALLLLQSFYNITERQSLATSLVVMDGLVFVVPFALLLSGIQANLLWLSNAASGACTLLVLLLVARRIQKKEDVKGLLMIRERDDCIDKFDFTITASREEAVRLSERVLALAEKATVNTRLLKKLALVLEEMTLASVHYAHADKSGLIDILVHVTDREVTILMRDNGKPFNPLEYIPEENDGLITDSIGLVKKLASRMEYSRQLGFNTSVLTFNIQ